MIEALETPVADARRTRVRTLWLSDVHLGSRGCRAEALLDFLRRHHCERLYLVGDIVDGWSLRRRWYWPSPHTEVLSELLRRSRQECHLTYLTGNHDDFLRRPEGRALAPFELADELVHETVDGRRLLVLHGDRFDRAVHEARWLSRLGDAAVGGLQTLDGCCNALRGVVGWRERSLARTLREGFKQAVAYVQRFERAVVEGTRPRGVDGVVCGHVHHPALREEGDFLYANDGDWVESCTALAEHFDGRLELLRWPGEGRPDRHDRSTVPAAERRPSRPPVNGCSPASEAVPAGRG